MFVFFLRFLSPLLRFGSVFAFLKKKLLFRFCAIASDFFKKFSSHALVLIFLSFFSSCCFVSVLPFFEERSSFDSNPP